MKRRPVAVIGALMLGALAVLPAGTAWAAGDIETSVSAETSGEHVRISVVARNVGSDPFLGQAYLWVPSAHELGRSDLSDDGGALPVECVPADYGFPIANGCQFEFVQQAPLPPGAAVSARFTFRVRTPAGRRVPYEGVTEAPRDPNPANNRAAGSFVSTTPDSTPDLTLSLESLSPRSFRALPAGPSVQPTAMGGALVTFQLDWSAVTTFRVERAAPGRRVRGRCVAPTAGNRRSAPCTRYVPLAGSFQVAGGPGLNRFRFSGRLAGRRLSPGQYRLVARARDALGLLSVPPPERAGFSILR